MYFNIEHFLERNIRLVDWHANIYFHVRVFSVIPKLFY